jgi:phosphoribosylformylglycinamidine cyclo-ligase
VKQLRCLIFIKKGEFDLAGTIVGVVDRNQLITGKSIRKGDKLFGFKSNGLHTNGYSLARKVFFNTYDVDDTPDGWSSTVGEDLLRVHKSYLPHISALKDINGVNGFSHITGGGIEGNTKRILPEGCSLSIDWDSWERPDVFRTIKDLGNVPEEDMRATFNLGIGLIAVVHPNAESQVREKTGELGEEIIEMGEII